MSFDPLIARLGEPVQFSYETGEAVDVATGIFSPGTPVTLDTFGVPASYKSAEIDGTVIQSGDLRLTVQSTAHPQVGWLCAVDGVSYRVQHVQKVRKSGVTQVYIAQLRAS